MTQRIASTASLIFAVTLLGIVIVAPVYADESTQKPKDKEAERLEDARQVFLELRNMSDAEIPEPLLDKCKCIAVFPGVVKGALGWGGRRGKGVMTCRNAQGIWGPPIFLTLTGGSFGLQIGVEKAEVVLFFMNDRGARSLVESKFTLGGKGSVAAGPVGRTAEAATDIKLNAEIYSYARTKGLFAGLSLEGAKLGPDKDATNRFYGKPVEPMAVLFEHKVPTNPPSAQKFLAALP
jgi:lipid-binding SYLF domain-containing protein